MKNLLTLIISLFGATAYAQFPVTQTLGSPTTIVKSKGAFKADTLFVNAVYPDTIKANTNPSLKAYPGGQIFTTSDNSVWYRNATATGWIKYASGTIASGTVTSFSKTDNFGITSSVTNPTTTPNHAVAVDSIVVTSRIRHTNDSAALRGLINTNTSNIALKVSSVTATSPILSSGGTTPNISMPAATGSVNGYLTSADHLSFSNKYDSLRRLPGSVQVQGKKNGIWVNAFIDSAGGGAAGTTGQIQYNNGGAFAANSNFTFDGVNEIILAGFTIAVGGSGMGLNVYNNGSSGVELDGLTNIYTNGGLIGLKIGNGGNALPSSQLEVESTKRGFLTPRMTTVQRDSIASPAEGLELYNLTTHAKNTFNGTAWITTGGVSSLSAIGATSNANGATITGSVLNLQPASASFGGVVTTGAQTFEGAKTLNQTLKITANESLIIDGAYNIIRLRLSSANEMQIGQSAGTMLTIGSSSIGASGGLSVTQSNTVGIGTTATNASAKVEIASTTQGFLPPRMTAAQMVAISSPATGLEIYNTTTNTKNISNGTNWTGGLTASSAATLTIIHGQDYVFTGTTSTWTLPAVSATLLGRGNSITIKNRGTGGITLNSNAGSTIYSSAAVGTFTISPGEAIMLMPDGTFFNVE